MRTSAVLGLGTIALLLGGCGSNGGVQQRLQLLRGCDDVEEAVRDAALQEMTEALERNATQAARGCRYYGDSAMALPAAGAQASAGAAREDSGGGASQVSTTNNQVAGVDEADFVKNDNRHIYMVSAGAFRIILAWPASSAREIGKLAIEGTPRKLFVLGDRALIYSSITPATGAPTGWQGRECSYGYSCSFTGDGLPTKISIVDISDRTAPRLVRELRSRGSYVNARRIGKAVHTVLTAPGPSFKGVQYWPGGVRCSTTDTAVTERAFAELWKANAKIILQTPARDLLPQLDDRLLEGGTPVASGNLFDRCQGFYKPERLDGSSFTTILSLDLTGTLAPTSSTIVSRPGAVYASPGALYVAVPELGDTSEDRYYGGTTAREATIIHRFDLFADPVASAYTGSGAVKGRVLNQFAMDEWEGHLRVATTTGHLPSPDVHSTLSVLMPQRGSLTTVGVLDRLAPKEDIRSVRFDGSRGFVVTFKKTDPLFVFDLGNPRAPRTLAELKIPGFSTYMHMMDSNHLLTIGYDASDQGDFAWFTGVRLQIFDVENPFAPRLAHVELIGTRGSSSEALTNHLAFTYFAPKQLLALPMTVCEGGDGSRGMYGTQMTFSGLMVYHAAPESGFGLKGKVPHPMDRTATCGNWWTNATSTVKRSIFMDDFVYSISDQRIKVNNVGSLGVDLAEIPVDR